ncbi:substrate-binding periplasmic protein [Alteromonas oceanisediminis]|uniref:substrate-binding periplasmic protein n=1 Tax=Alteromonas oceanisediminis TaxID=2836180 RepID=UPI001BDAA395|nr:transporter substrate-binding domain-containing protein [Alteromonas oceanisediminis]MBT0585894.1 transporter substrate-binding domain-containing protein [Alteromonas oceanisediminis]
MAILRSALLLLSVVCVSQASASEPDLRVYYERDYLPYNFSSNGEVDGINGIIVKAACRQANITCEFIEMPWNRARASALEDTIGGVLSMSRNAAREPHFKWVGPMVADQTAYFKLKSRTDIRIERTADVLNYTIGVSRHDVYEPLLIAKGFQVGENLLQTDVKHEPIRLFVLGKLDLMFGSKYTLPSNLKPHGLSADDVVAVAKLDTSSLKGNHLALNHKVPDSIVSVLNHEVRQFKQSPAFRRLLKRFKPATFRQPAF